ncbi:MAG: hypothetical protein AAB445_00740 [Patescibacteria group bacterium]
MNLVRKTYIEFLYPGVFLNESSTQEIKTRDVSRVKVPKNAYCFKFFDILSLAVKTEGEEVLLTSERINVSPRHYYGGKLYTIAELKREFPNERVLIGNIEGNGYKQAIRCRTGNWQTFTETDILIKAA